MATISLESAKKDLAALIDRARSGEEIIIASHNQPLIKLAPIESSYRGFGALKGQFTVNDEDLLAPLTDEDVKLWNYRCG